VVPEQVEEGAMAALHDGTFDRVTMHVRDFRDTGLPDASLDGAYAVESLCYAAGRGKGEALKEIARVLKPGATLAVMDGFLLKRPRGWRKPLVDAIADGWALPCFPGLHAFIAELWRQGFRNVDVKDISWRMGPSALHGLPLLVFTLLRQLFSGGKMDALEKAHLRSCGLGILLGTQYDLFRYCRITATRT
jgi:SAM-dependent methyltransferase